MFSLFCLQALSADPSREITEDMQPILVTLLSLILPKPLVRGLLQFLFWTVCQLPTEGDLFELTKFSEEKKKFSETNFDAP